MPITQENINFWFTYHAPNGDVAVKYAAIRAAGRKFAEAILENTPSSPDQTVAIRAVREATMWANASIACEGK